MGCLFPKSCSFNHHFCWWNSHVWWLKQYVSCFTCLAIFLVVKSTCFILQTWWLISENIFWLPTALFVHGTISKFASLDRLNHMSCHLWCLKHHLNWSKLQHQLYKPPCFTVQSYFFLPKTIIFHKTTIFHSWINPVFGKTHGSTSIRHRSPKLPRWWRCQQPGR